MKMTAEVSLDLVKHASDLRELLDAFSDDSGRRKIPDDAEMKVKIERQYRDMPGAMDDYDKATALIFTWDD